MQMIYLDESGYAPQWQSAIDEQPFYTLSAVCLPMDTLPQAYAALRSQIAAYQRPDRDAPLGQGFEIKARDIAQGRNWWHGHEQERNEVRRAMLSAPAQHGGTAFVVVIDKQAHLDRYVAPDDPDTLAVQFILERLQGYLQDRDDFGYCVCDRTRDTEQTEGRVTQLIRNGSAIQYYSPFWNMDRAFVLELDRLLEMASADSLNSVGLQTADFFATMTYQYYKNGQPQDCGWWDILMESLYRHDGVLLGWGLKQFP